MPDSLRRQLRTGGLRESDPDWHVYVARWGGQGPGLLNTMDEENMHHRFTFSYMGRPKDMEILADYGYVGVKDDDGKWAMIVRFTREFQAVETGLRVSAGWIAPDGTMLPCHGHEHDAVAYRYLVIETGDEPNGHPGEILRNMGWIELYADGYPAQGQDQGATREQMDTLSRLAEMAGPESPYAAEVKRFLDVYAVLDFEEDK